MYDKDIMVMKPHPNHTHPHGRYAHEKFSLRSETLCSSLRSRHEPHVHVLHMIHDVCPFPVSSSGSLSAPITMCLIPVPTFKIDAVHTPWLPCQQSRGARGREEFRGFPTKTHPEGRGDEQEAWQG